MNVAHVLGRYGEDRAVAHVRDRGWTVLDRNWRCNAGELDVVALDGDCLVVVEVRTRRSDAYGHPFETITPEKLGRLRRLAVRWLTEHDVHVAALRIDIVGVLVPRRGLVTLEHLEGVA